MTYRNYRELTDEEIRQLEDLYPVTTNRELSRRFGISVDALQDFIAYPRGWKKDLKALRIGNRNGRTLTEKETQWIIRHYQHTKNEDIMQKFGIGESALHRIARKHGLKKSRQQMKKTQQEATQAAWQACKDYGVYEEASRRMTEKMKAMSARGEYIPGSFMPGQSNKDRLTPKRFKECMEKGHKKRNETIRKERIRIHFGLPQKTRLNLTYGGYDEAHKKKALHRHLFRKLGYIVERSSDEVYYNEETERRPKMEANAHLYGLRVMAMG